MKCEKHLKHLSSRRNRPRIKDRLVRDTQTQQTRTMGDRLQDPVFLYIMVADMVHFSYGRAIAIVVSYSGTVYLASLYGRMISLVWSYDLPCMVV